MHLNKLTFNYSRALYMLIGLSGIRLHYFTVQINDNTAPQTRSTKYLGCFSKWMTYISW